MLQQPATTDEAAQNGQSPMIATGLAAATPKRSISTQAVVLGVVLVASAGALFGMRHFGLGPGTAIGGTVKIDYKVGDGSPNAPDGYADILAALDRSGRPLQIAADQITQDPFVLNAYGMDDESLLTADEGEAPDARAARMIREREAQRQREIRDAFGQLQLASVIGGRVPVARIGRDIVRVGDPLGEFFTVVEIHGRSVILETDEGWQFTLTMEDTGLGDQMSVTPIPKN